MSARRKKSAEKRKRLDELTLKRIFDPALAHALRHPFRGHALATIGEKGVCSPKEVASELGVDVSDLGFHFRELRDRGLIRLSHTERRNGFDEHFYELTEPAVYLDDRDWQRLPPELRGRMGADLLELIVKETTAAILAGTLGARDEHLSYTPMTVDEAGWSELMETVRGTLEAVLRIRRDCAARLRQSGEPGIPVCVAIAGFERAPGD